MKHPSEAEIRRSFANCSKGEAARARIPTDLDERPWSDLDFFGWRDPGAPERAYLVAERDGRLLGLVLRAAKTAARGFTARSMCSLCLTTHTSGGVTLMTARRAGDAGRQGDAVGQYLCTDLACSLYVRGRRHSAGGLVVGETLEPDVKAARLRENLAAFLDRVTEEPARR